MKVLLTGGGSGGHITPVLSVAHELKKRHNDAQLIYAIGKGDKLVHLPQQDETIDHVVTIRSGKFRRYHGEGLKQLFDIPTLLKNIRDFFFVLVGIIQALHMLRRERPDAIFIKGGFVGVPVGLAAAILNIPYITHDSDAVPGLANRIIAHWAKKHAVAMPIETYSYPAEKTIQVGVPISAKYHKITPAQKKSFRQDLGIPTDAQVLYVTGGGLGAQRLNEAVTKVARRLLVRHPKLYILHIVGPGHSKAVQTLYDVEKGDVAERVIIKDFINNAHVYSGAADIIVTRAGATTLAEFAAQQKACIVVANPQLTGGHQLKNVAVLEDKGAVLQIGDVVLQKDPDLLQDAIQQLLDSSEKRTELGAALGAFADHDAAHKLADLVVGIAKVAG